MTDKEYASRQIRIPPVHDCISHLTRNRRRSVYRSSYPFFLILGLCFLLSFSIFFSEICSYIHFLLTLPIILSFDEAFSRCLSMHPACITHFGRQSSAFTIRSFQRSSLPFMSCCYASFVLQCCSIRWSLIMCTFIPVMFSDLSLLGHEHIYGMEETSVMRQNSQSFSVCL
ncbi:hypothetical protein VTN96DRAFT_9748 [Rasamsonia emersonii]